MRKRAHEKHTEELKHKEQEIDQKEEKVIQRDQQINGIQSHTDEIDPKSASTKLQTANPKLAEKEVQDNAAAEARARYCLPQSTPVMRGKLYPFEVPQKEQVSISSTLNVRIFCTYIILASFF